MIVASTVYGGDNRVGLTLIPPGTITNKVDLDIRAGIVNQGTEQQDFKISIYLNNVEQQSLLHYSTITLPIGASHSIKYVLNTTDKVGNNRIILRVEDGKQSYEVTKKFEVIESDIRSTRLIDGAWAGIYHWSEIEGKHCVVIGRSNIVGKPMALLMLRENATVTIAHSKTKNLKELCKQADILIVAIGKPKFIDESYVKEGAVVIDVGIHRNEENKLCGDVDFEKVEPHTSAITPVPGGVGPMTIAMLMNNCVESMRGQK